MEKRGVVTDVQEQLGNKLLTQENLEEYFVIGDKSDPVNDVFIPKKPYSNWVWSDSKNNWVAPVADPSVNANEYNAVWDQENNRWGGINGDVSVYWDPDTSSWKNA